MEFGTALLLDRTQILQNDHIYIIQFCVLNPFQTTQDTIKLLELPISQIFHALATQYHMKISFQLTNQRNKLLEKGKIVHKVLELNMVVFIHVHCCSYFF